MNKNQKIQKFLTWTFFVTACLITQARAQDLADESQQSVKTNASTILTTDDGTKAAQNFDVAAPAALTVNNNGDESDANTADGICATAANVCTLRAAVEQANVLPSNDVIEIKLGTNPTITLTSGTEIVIGNNGTLQINGGGGLKIDGGTGQNRIFYSDGATVTIVIMTLQGGNGAGAINSGYGGAIFANGGSLTLGDVQVWGNSATISGGGIYFLNGTHDIIGTTFSANNAAPAAVLARQPAI